MCTRMFLPIRGSPLIVHVYVGSGIPPAKHINVVSSPMTALTLFGFSIQYGTAEVYY